MSTTLTNGLKLPDKGSVDWYANMQSNYNILDGAVGTVAAHTAALSGKAPLVHTHTKSDITDLFNSANTWAADNTFNNAIYALSLRANNSAYASGTPSNNVFYAPMSMGGFVNNIWIQSLAINGAVRTNGYNDFSIRVYSQTSNTLTGVVVETDADASVINFRPISDGTHNLGNSSYQWNNLYAKGYYYNGVAWGLDKANTWTGNNTFTGNIRPIRLRGSDDDIYNVQPQSVVESQIGFVDKNNNIMSHIAFQHRPDATETHRLCLRQSMITVNAYYSINLNNLGDFYPEQNNTINLGTSTNKWKTLNGINPGALSLPASHYVSIDTTGWDLTRATYNRVYINNANPTFPGILFIRINSSDPVSILVKFFSTSGSEIAYSGSKMEAGSNNMIATVPCPPNTNIYVQIETTSTITACRYYTLLGDPEFNSRSSS